MGEAGPPRDYEQALRVHRALWAEGDYRRVAEQLTGVSAAVVEAAGIGPGLRVLDLGAGSGNTAILAAGRGAEMTAVDLADDPLARISTQEVGATLPPDCCARAGSRGP